MSDAKEIPRGELYEKSNQSIVTDPDFKRDFHPYPDFDGDIPDFL